ncbi:DUF1330 domain-containing protein [Ralstonia solanacearum]|nr:DUF1330 domain-containing protein [Ralstonia solanacearum]MBB6595031.1 DUF1330 domain-containing protein [Ralstonia solanacearum]
MDAARAERKSDAPPVHGARLVRSHTIRAGIGLLVTLSTVVTTPLLAQDKPEQTEARPAYYIAEFEPAVAGAIRPYSERVESTIQPFGGRFIVRGGKLDALEGPSPKSVVVVIAFGSLERAQAWYHSPAYEKLKPIRHRAGTSRVYIVEGVTHP